VHVPSHELGNLEWHVMRAMHLAGRCINCGECRRACPMDIPLNLLTQKLIVEIENNFGVKSAENPDDIFVLATFSKDDKENFIR
jgi:Na+-translocating ferredoxin:NAD+ oxidoreductase RnfC subunit